MKKNIVLLLAFLVVSMGVVAATSIGGAGSVEVGAVENYNVVFESYDVFSDGPVPQELDWTTGKYQTRWCNVAQFDLGAGSTPAEQLVGETGFLPCVDGDSLSYEAHFDTAGTHIIQGVMIQTTQEFIDGEWVVTEQHKVIDNTPIHFVSVEYPMSEPPLLSAPLSILEVLQN